MEAVPILDLFALGAGGGGGGVRDNDRVRVGMSNLLQPCGSPTATIFIFGRDYGAGEGRLFLVLQLFSHAEYAIHTCKLVRAESSPSIG